MPKYRLKDGVVLRPYGVKSLIDNSNLTDSIAELLLAKSKAKVSDFMIQKQIKKTNKKTVK